MSLIAKQIWEVDYYDSGGGYKLTGEITDIVNRQLCYIMDEISSEVLGNKTLRIEKLEIDLGIFDEGLFTNEIITRFSDLYRDKLISLSVDLISEEQSSVSLIEKNNKTDILLYFLINGVLPWYAEDITGTEMEEAIDVITSLEAMSLFKENLLDADLYLRLTVNFSDERIIQLISRLILNKQTDIEAVINPQLLSYRNYIKENNKKIDITVNEFRAMIYRIVVLALIDKSENNLPAKMSYYIQNEAGIPQELKDILLSCIKENYNEKDEKTGTSNTNPFAISQKDPEQKPDQANDEPMTSFKGIEETAIPDISDDISEDGLKDRSIDRIFENSKHGKDFENEIVDATVQNAIPDRSALYRERKDESDKYYIRNAGLVLIFPFVQRLFERLDLTKENNFVSKECAYTGINLLEYIVTGKDESKEFDQTLNKVLCGLEIYEPVDISIILGEKEKAEADLLLQSMIDNWKALKNTSLDGLRRAFLQRKGILYNNGDSFTLKVEKESYDVLLDRMLWSYNVIKFPWMKKILYTEWGTNY